jgi:hypothetical protein
MKKMLYILLMLPLALQAQQDSVRTSNDLFDMSLEQLLNLEVVDRNFYLYGYINSNLQKTFDYPSLNSVNGMTRVQSDPFEFTPVKNFHIYGKGNFNSKISYLFNLARKDDFVEIRNAWGNFMIYDLLQVRVGKMYRKFGLYNERLDQIPTFIGIEAPEMLDTDHLFLSRTTSFMVHGSKENPSGQISYALMTDNGENGPVKNMIPLGWDLRYKSFTNSLIIGTSGYASSITNVTTRSKVRVGAGAPDGGILPWMSNDRFNVTGMFMEKQFGKLLLQSEYYRASHIAKRDPAAVMTLLNEADINDGQRERFFGDKAAEAVLTSDDVIVDTRFIVQTFYIRLGYNVQKGATQLVPYLMVDWMSNPEVIQNKKFGGDDEAGLADDGKFLKPSVGVVYRPIQNVAIKFDGSYHTQNFNGEKISYPELRLDFSFAFSNSVFGKIID